MEDQSSTRRNGDGTMLRTETLSKLIPLRSRADSDRDPSSQRSRLRNALPSSNPLRGQQSSNKAKIGHSHRQAAKETVHSALELRPPINFDHLLRRDKKQNTRRDSDGDGKEEELTLAQQHTQALRQSVRADDVFKISEQNVKREEELRQALQSVEDQSMQSTRALDDTYYLLLEKAESLRQLVLSMQALARESQRSQDDFREQTRQLQHNTQANMKSYGDFKEQEDQINDLLQQLGKSKDRTARLNERLDSYRQRTDRCERKILRAQATRRKRWSITWATLLALVVLLLAIILFRRHSPSQIVMMGTSMDRAREGMSDAVLPILSRLAASPSEDPYLHKLFESIS